MKKIFIPLLALCGMVTGFTLTSCGGGGSDSLTGRTYDFDRTFAQMTIVFGTKYSQEDINDEFGGSLEEYEATVSFKGGADDTCRVKIQKNDGNVHVQLLGAAPDLLTDNAVLAFLGQSLIQDMNEDAVDNYNFTISIEGGFPNKLNTSAKGTIFIQQLNQDEAEDGVEGDVEALNDANEGTMIDVIRKQ